MTKRNGKTDAKLVFTFALILTLSGCASFTTSYPVASISYPLSNEKLNTTCRTKEDSNRSKYNIELIAKEERKEISDNVLPFAQMSSSAYQAPQNQLPIINNWERYGRYENSFGFGADVYVNTTTYERVIAYRGTTPTFGGGILDFLTGNNPFLGRFLQYRDARKVFRKVRNSCRECKISVTGHSLGGGLAAHVGLKFKNVDVYTFNRSPLVFTKWFGRNNNSGRIDVEETGELLNFTRTFLTFFGKLKFWNTYNADHTWRYNLRSGNAIEEHGISGFAQCLKHRI